MARPTRALPTVWGRAPKGDAKRLAVTLFALLAFVLQTFVVQTHIHGSALVGPAPLAAEQLAGQLAERGQQPDKFPPGDDPANCPICQELLHAGSYVAPTVAVLQVSTVVTVVDVVVVEIAAIRQVTAHGWTSRGPPLA